MINRFLFCSTFGLWSMSAVNAVVIYAHSHGAGESLIGFLFGIISFSALASLASDFRNVYPLSGASRRGDE